MSKKKTVISIIIAAAAGIALGVCGTLGVQAIAGANQEEESPELGGVAVSNPVAGMSEEEALAIAAQLGEGQDYGSWRGMSGEEFLAWWRSSNGIGEDESK